MLDTVICRCRDWPHVDEVLGQGDALAVPADGDGPVQVGGGVAVLAVGDADHRAADLSETTHIPEYISGLKQYFII